MTTRVMHCSNCGLTGHNKRSCKIDTKCRRKVKRKPSISLKQKKPEYDLCPICMDDCKGKTCTLECGHTFHTKCIFTWFKKNNNCPCCRAEVPEMKKAVDTQKIELPSPAFMGAMMRMVDESFAVENTPVRAEDITPQTYVEAVMVFTNLTLSRLSPERMTELRQMEGATGGW